MEMSDPQRRVVLKEQLQPMRMVEYLGILDLKPDRTILVSGEIMEVGSLLRGSTPTADGARPQWHPNWFVGYSGWSPVTGGSWFDLESFPPHGDFRFRLQTHYFDDQRATGRIRLVMNALTRISGKTGVPAWTEMTYARQRYHVRLGVPEISAGAGEGEIVVGANLSWADDSPVDKAIVVLHGQDGRSAPCTSADNARLRCTFPGTSVKGLNPITADVEVEGRPAERVTPESWLSPKGEAATYPEFSIALVEPVISVGDVVRISIHGLNPDPRLSSCSGAELLSVGLEGEPPVVIQPCALSAPDRNTVEISGVTGRPGSLEAVAVFRDASGRVVEVEARALVVPVGGLNGFQARVRSDRRTQIRLSKHGQEADTILMWMTENPSVEENTLSADQIASSVLGMVPDRGYFNVSSPPNHPATTLYRAVRSNERAPEVLNSLRNGYSVRRPFHQQRVRSLAAAVLASSSNSVYRKNVEERLRKIAVRWRKLEAKLVHREDSRQRCSNILEFDSFVRDLLTERLAAQKKADFRARPRWSLNSIQGLDINWYGPDGVYGTEDDIPSHVVVSCGADSKWEEPVITVGDATPIQRHYRMVANSFRPTRGARVWIESGVAKRKTDEWTVAAPHPGPWWVHAIGFRAGRLHFAQVWELDIPIAGEVK